MKFSRYRKFDAGGHLFSHTVASAVPSAVYGLTIVFGMGTGVTHKRITTSKFLVASAFAFRSAPYGAASRFGFSP